MKEEKEVRQELSGAGFKINKSPSSRFPLSNLNLKVRGAASLDLLLCVSARFTCGQRRLLLTGGTAGASSRSLSDDTMMR